MESCAYQDIQTPVDVWKKILELNPIDDGESFYEPFAGDNTLFSQIQTNKKYWSEITKGKDVFDFDKKELITTIYTNPPFKSLIPNAKGEKVYKNAVFYFLDYFVSSYPNLKRIGFLINAKSFTALTPCRLAKLDKKGFKMTSLCVLNTNYWYGCYYFVVFEQKQTNKEIIINYIEKTFTQKHIKE
jgi:hypothetical protein